MARAGIALGSNLGDRDALIAAAVVGIDRLPATQIVLRSSLWESDPVDCSPGAGPFLNAAVEIETALAPLALLERLQGIETALGRPRVRPANSPRTVDLDILYYDGVVVDHPRLVIPHPRASKRAFVLLPLAEIRPAFVLPGSTETVRDAARSLPPAARRSVRRRGALP